MATAWRSADRRLSGAQAELALQEESVRRSKRECRATLDQMAVLERSLQATESELRASQVGRSGGPVGAGPRVLCDPLPETQPVGTACGSSLGADPSPVLSVHVLQGEGLGPESDRGSDMPWDSLLSSCHPWVGVTCNRHTEAVLISFGPGPGSLNVCTNGGALFDV